MAGDADCSTGVTGAVGGSNRSGVVRRARNAGV